MCKLYHQKKMITIRTFGIATQMTFQFIGQQLDVYVCMCEGWGMANQLRRVNGLYEHVLNNGHGDNGYEVYRWMIISLTRCECSKRAGHIPTMKLLSRWSMTGCGRVRMRRWHPSLLNGQQVVKMPEDTQMTESQRDISNIMKIYVLVQFLVKLC